ncbi:hypothetical protein ACFLTH_17665 [Bacteroidota bacterium]
MKKLIVLDAMGCAYYLTKEQQPKKDRQYFENVLERKYTEHWAKFIEGNIHALCEAELLEYKSENSEFNPIVDLGLFPLMNLDEYKSLWVPSTYEEASEIVLKKINAFEYFQGNILSVARFEDGSKKNAKAWFETLKKYEGAPIEFVIEDSIKNLDAAMEAVRKLSSIEPKGLLVTEGSKEKHKNILPIYKKETGYYEGSLLTFSHAIKNNYFAN